MAGKALNARFRRALPAMARASETAWNLREWIREVHADQSLSDVLDALLPGVRSQLELALIDGGLSTVAAKLPAGDDATAAGLIAFIESAVFPRPDNEPQGLHLWLPGGDVPPDARWSSLAELRAKRIAMQWVDDDGNLVCNPESDDDLSRIRQMDSGNLAELFRVCVGMNDGGHADCKTVTTTDSAIAPENRTRPMSKKEACRFLGKKTKNPSQAITRMGIRFVPLGKSFVFDRTDFPKSAWKKILTPASLDALKNE